MSPLPQLIASEICPQIASILLFTQLEVEAVTWLWLSANVYKFLVIYFQCQQLMLVDGVLVDAVLFMEMVDGVWVL